MSIFGAVVGLLVARYVHLVGRRVQARIAATADPERDRIARRLLHQAGLL